MYWKTNLYILYFWQVDITLDQSLFSPTISRQRPDILENTDAQSDDDLADKNDELDKESRVETKVFASIPEDPSRRKYKLCMASSCILTNVSHFIIDTINQVLLNWKPQLIFCQLYYSRLTLNCCLILFHLQQFLMKSQCLTKQLITFYPLWSM